MARQGVWVWLGRAHERGQTGRIGVARQSVWVWLDRTYGDIRDYDRSLKASPITKAYISSLN